MVAIDNDKVLGMVAYHRHSDERCEMKRLYVNPAARGRHLGDKLVTEILQQLKMHLWKFVRILDMNIVLGLIFQYVSTLLNC